MKLVVSLHIHHQGIQLPTKTISISFSELFSFLDHDFLLNIH